MVHLVELLKFIPNLPASEAKIFLRNFQTIID